MCRVSCLNQHCWIVRTVLSDRFCAVFEMISFFDFPCLVGLFLFEIAVAPIQGGRISFARKSASATKEGSSDAAKQGLGAAPVNENERSSTSLKLKTCICAERRDKKLRRDVACYVQSLAIMDLIADYQL